VRIVRPSALVAEAAGALAPVRDRVVLVGAAAVDVALAAAGAAITPTRDVDLVVGAEVVETVVRQLESDDFRRSELPHERNFTWVRGDLRIQLVRTFHPFPNGPAARLPANPVFGMAADPAHHDPIAFEAAPEQVRLLCARPLCLVALKEAAFGRVRPGDARPVERDYHDVHLLLRYAGNDLAVDLVRAGYEVRHRARRAMDVLADGGEATSAAARQLVLTGGAGTQRDAERDVQRTAERARRLLFGR
jgi:hypothetical protein